MLIKQGDILISKKPHSCEVKFVEGCDKSGVLLVDGIKDEFYRPEDLGILHGKYKLLVRKEDRLDSEDMRRKNMSTSMVQVDVFKIERIRK